MMTLLRVRYCLRTLNASFKYKTFSVSSKIKAYRSVCYSPYNETRVRPSIQYLDRTPRSPFLLVLYMTFNFKLFCII